MRHAHVPRFVWSLTVLFVLAAVAFALR